MREGSTAEGEAAGAMKAAGQAIEDAAEVVRDVVMNKKTEVVFFSSTAIALYGYDQGMMSLVNTNYNYLATMGIGEKDPLVAVIVSVYYLGCAAGALLGSKLADKRGRKPGIIGCMVTTCLGNLIMFFSGMGFERGAMWMMLLGRVIMGLGVGGFDAVIPVYSSELSDEDTRGQALAQEFQANIFGLNMAFILNVLVTRALGKNDQWAWRIPIIAMQIYPLILFALLYRLPESPRWFLSKDRDDQAKDALAGIYDEFGAKKTFEKLDKARQEEASKPVSYIDLLFPWADQYHPTVVTVMGQVNQALTGYGCLSVYGAQIFELLGFGVETAEHITMANYISYFFMMTFAWMYIDVIGRRALMLWGSVVLTGSFLLLTLFGGLVLSTINVPEGPFAVLGTVTLFISTAAFGIGWLVPPWLVPVEIYPSPARAKGAAVSVIIWGFANFGVTFISPILFNNLDYWIFLVFAATNAIAGLWTWIYSPETGGRTFEENASFFIDAKEDGTWRVHKVDGGKFRSMPHNEKGEEAGETAPLLGNR